MRSRREQQQGIPILIMIIMFVALIPVVGLAIDAGALYVVRGRLSSAVDAAALAAGPSISPTRFRPPTLLQRLRRSNSSARISLAASWDGRRAHVLRELCARD